MNRIYKNKQFNLYQYGREYIIHNTYGNFSDHHSHINNYKTAKFLINLALHKTVPKKPISEYLINSLIRISTDKIYIDKLEKLKRNKCKSSIF